MTRKGGLGKGLSALLSRDDILDVDSPGFFQCPIDKIRPNPTQPRRQVSQDSVEALAQSIREKGILQPLVVREVDGGYELIAGERRWRAAQRAGLRAVPVVIKDVSAQEVLELALIENIQREDLNPLEEAMAYGRLVDDLGLTQAQVAARVGKERSTVANFLRLLTLPAYAKEDVVNGLLSSGHARALLMVESVEGKRQLRDQIVAKDLSVRQAEALARKLSGPKTSSAAVSAKDDPDIRRLCEDLTVRVGSRVNIVHGKKGGRLEIRYGSSEELERLIDMLRGLGA